MSEREPPKSLDEIAARISRVRQSEQKLYGKPGEPPSASKSAFGQAMRIGLEMVSALAVGFFIGWALDRWLGTSPWLKIVFLLFGAAAGVLNVYRLARGFGYATGYQEPEDQEGQENQKDEAKDRP